MEIVRIGIIGFGNMGSAHSRNIYEGNINNLKLTALCDIDESKLTRAKQQFGEELNYETDYKKLLASDKIDAVLIATPHYLHPIIAKEAFEKGLHVLTEKPAGVSVSQVQQMNSAAKKAGTIFGIMYNQRTNPYFQKVRELVRSGRVGQLKRMVWIITNWYRTQAYYDSGDWRATWAGEGGGVLLNQCPHNLDLWQWIFGMPKRVKGFCSYGEHHQIEVEDDVTVYAEYENGAKAVFITSTGEYPGTNRLEISGDRGKLVLENETIKFYELEVPEREVCFEAKNGFHKIPYQELNLEVTGTETAHSGILQNFTDAILYGEPLLAPGEEGILGLSISNAIYLSDWTGTWAEIPMDVSKFDSLLQEHIKNSKKLKISEDKEQINTGYSERWSVRW